MLSLFDNYKLNGERASTVREKNDVRGTKTVNFITIQAAGGTETSLPHSATNSRGQIKMYL